MSCEIPATSVIVLGKGYISCSSPSPDPVQLPEGVKSDRDYPRIAFKSASGVVMGLMSKVFTRVSSTLGVRKAGSDGPMRMPLIPK